MKLEPFENPFDHFAATLEVEPGTRVFFLNGSPVGYLQAGDIRLSASVHLETFREAFPGYADRAGKADSIPEREVAALLLFRDRDFNRQLQYAFSAMPLGVGRVCYTTPEGALDFGQISSNVEAMRAELSKHADRDRQLDAELQKYRDAIRGLATLATLVFALAGEADVPPRAPRPCDGSEG
jgi:hypothetical protein